MKIQNYLLMAALLFLAGCASGKPYAELAQSLNRPLSGKARIIIFRDNPIGLAIQPEIKLNNKIVGKSIPNGFFSCKVKPGTYTLTAKTETTATTVVTVVPGQTVMVRTGIGLGLFVGRPNFEQIPGGKPDHFLKDLKQIPSTC